MPAKKPLWELSPDYLARKLSGLARGLTEQQAVGKPRLGELLATEKQALLESETQPSKETELRSIHELPPDERQTTLLLRRRMNYNAKKGNTEKANQLRSELYAKIRERRLEPDSDYTPPENGYPKKRKKSRKTMSRAEKDRRNAYERERRKRYPPSDRERSIRRDKERERRARKKTNK